jgi:hypothetical protein
MNSRQKKLIRLLQFIVYPIAAIMMIAFVWDFYRVMTGSGVEILIEGERAPQTDWIALAIVLIFWVVFLALLIEFLAREIFRRASREGMGTVVLEIGGSQSPLRFIPLLAVVPFVVGFNLFLINPGVIEIDIASASLVEHLVFWLFYGIAHLLFVAFLLRAIRNRPFFIATEKGFLYEPGDVSPGLIRWEDVAEIKDAELLYGQGTVSGPTTRPVLAVGLKDADKYSAKYTPLLGMLNRLLTKGIRYQTGGPGDLVLRPEDFGARYGEVRDLMMKNVRKRAG